MAIQKTLQKIPSRSPHLDQCPTTPVPGSESGIRRRPSRHHEPLFDSKYEIRGMLGEGAFGFVQRAFDRETGMEVALKRLNPRRQCDSVKKLLENEAKAMKLISHEGVVAFVSKGAFEGSPYIAMEYIEGIDLTHASKEFLMVLCNTLDLCAQACDALSAMHAKGIIHRDIKPGNLMLWGYGGLPKIKIIDLGYAKITRQWDFALVADHPVGTFHFMAPEQTRTRRAVDHRADIYSLGLSMYQMLSGILPFDHSNVYRLIECQMSREPVPLSRIRPDLPEEAVSIIQRAIKKDPDERFQSAMEMKGAIIRCMGA